MDRTIGDISMAQIIFILIIILKESMELLALYRGQIELKVIRILLVLICLMCLQLMARGIVSEWPMLLQMILAGCLICDIIVIWSNKLACNLGGNIK